MRQSTALMMLAWLSFGGLSNAYAEAGAAVRDASAGIAIETPR